MQQQSQIITDRKTQRRTRRDGDTQRGGEAGAKRKGNSSGNLGARRRRADNARTSSSGRTARKLIFAPLDVAARRRCAAALIVNYGAVTTGSTAMLNDDVAMSSRFDDLRPSLAARPPPALQPLVVDGSGAAIRSANRSRAPTGRCRRSFLAGCPSACDDRPSRPVVLLPVSFYSTFSFAAFLACNK